MSSPSIHHLDQFLRFIDGKKRKFQWLSWPHSIDLFNFDDSLFFFHRNKYILFVGFALSSCLWTYESFLFGWIKNQLLMGFVIIKCISTNNVTETTCSRMLAAIFCTLPVNLDVNCDYGLFNTINSPQNICWALSAHMNYSQTAPF